MKTLSNTQALESEYEIFQIEVKWTKRKEEKIKEENEKKINC